MSTFLVDVHLVGLEVVELFTDGGLVFGSQSGPWLVGSPIVLVARGHFDIITKFDYLKEAKEVDKVAQHDRKIIAHLSIFKFIHGRSKA